VSLTFERSISSSVVMSNVLVIPAKAGIPLLAMEGERKFGSLLSLGFPLADASYNFTTLVRAGAVAS
jgi:hypothetical protein